MHSESEIIYGGSEHYRKTAPLNYMHFVPNLVNQLDIAAFFQSAISIFIHTKKDSLIILLMNPVCVNGCQLNENQYRVLTRSVGQESERG